jgi:hypothetical protein
MTKVVAVRALLTIVLVGLCGQGTLPSKVHATPLTLADLLAPGAGAAIVADDKVFFNFRNFASAGIGGAVAVNPVLVDVLPKSDAFGPGLRFVSAAQFFVGPGQVQNTRFDYDVAILPGGRPIIDASLELIAFGVIGPGTIVVREDIADGLGNALGTNFGFDAAPADVINFAPQAKLTVSDLISLTAGTGGANLMEFREDFSEVPEPSTILLLGAGLAGLVILGRRHRRRS